MNEQQATEYLESIGLTVPPIIIEAWLGLFSGVTACLDEHYNEATALLILTNLIGLYALAGGNRYVSSQSAPSGASQSFRFSGLNDIWKGNLNMIKLLDRHGCVSGLIPVNPTQTKSAFLMTGKGGCYE